MEKISCQLNFFLKLKQEKVSNLHSELQALAYERINCIFCRLKQQTIGWLILKFYSRHPLCLWASSFTRYSPRFQVYVVITMQLSYDYVHDGAFPSFKHTIAVAYTY